MTCYTDFYVNPQDPDVLEGIIEKLKKLGYCRVGIDYRFYKSINLERINRYGISLFWVNIIEASTRKEAARKLSSSGKAGKPLNLVVARNINVARYASVNKRFAGLYLLPGHEKYVDKSTFKLFKERGWGVLVFPLRFLLEPVKSRRTWRFYYIGFRRAYAYGISIALASAATNPGEVWHPYSAAGVASLFGIPGEIGRIWLSSSPLSVLSVFNLSEE